MGVRVMENIDKSGVDVSVDSYQRAEVKTYAIIEQSTGLVVNVSVWDGESDWQPDPGYIAVMSETAQIGWTYKDGEFTPPPPTEAEIRAANWSTLQQNTSLANSQKTSLASRISTLQDAIDLEMATDAEVAELPKRQTQLTEWKKYAVYLGRVTTQPGWDLTVDWPAQPKSGIDTVSATASSTPTS